jgi:flagellar hook-associated protein 1 FlgK
MAGADILGIGTSGLLAYQRAIATTGHNISNAATEGYSRQRTEFSTQTPQYAGFGYLGAGVKVAGVERVYNEFLNGQVQASTTDFGRLDGYYNLALRLDTMLSDNASSLSTAIQEFFNAVHDVAGEPASMTARETLQSEALTLSERFGSLDRRLQEMRQDINSELDAAVSDINDLAKSIARLNQDIAAKQASGLQPNDLLDQRDQLLTRLSGLVGTTSVTQQDGTVNVFIGRGQSLVIGHQAFSLATMANVYDPTRKDIGYQTSGGNIIDMTTQLAGGRIGGLLDFRRQALEPALGSIGHLAQTFAANINAQHTKGMDLEGNLGANFFQTDTPQVLTAATNTGTGSLAVSVANTAALVPTDYLARYNGAGSWTVTRLTDGVTTTGAGPFALDGLVIAPAGAPVAGDSFLIRPAGTSAATLRPLLSSARQVAAAAPIRTAANIGNLGDAAISAGEVQDATNPALLTTVTLVFANAANYQVNGAGPLIPYVSGANIDLNGWRVQIAGTPAAGDSFKVEKNTGGSGDNRNALALADQQSANLLHNGTSSYEGAYGQLVATVGTRAHSAEINLNAQRAIRDQAVAARESVAGVNLDEEAANLVRFQQIYQAAAQVISVANDLFDSLLASVRR